MNNENIPCTSPVRHENKFITDFKLKADIFNCFFANQCVLVENSNSKLSLECERKTHNVVFTFEFINIWSRYD